MTQGKDRQILRELAKRQLEYANLDIMKKRKENWQKLNTGISTQPLIVIDNTAFPGILVPEAQLSCISDPARRIERELLTRIRNHEIIDDDKVIPDTFDIKKDVRIDFFGINIERTSSKDDSGMELGYCINHPIRDITTDLSSLKPAVCTYNEDLTNERITTAQEMIGDILTVRSVCAPGGYISMLTQKAVVLLGMQYFFICLYDHPGYVHILMDHLAKNAEEIIKWHEENKLLTLNNGNDDIGPASFGFTDELPGECFDPVNIKVRDLWLWSDSQETVGISPQMFGEYIFPYYKRLFDKIGSVYYGCCEPVHDIWSKYLSGVENIRKISISPWSDEDIMGEMLKGTGRVYSRKPSPNFLSIGYSLDKEAWALHIRKTLKAARGCQLEFIVRDVYKLSGNLDKLKEAVGICRHEIQSFCR